jgi:hypothetical protein
MNEKATMRSPMSDINPHYLFAILWALIFAVSGKVEILIISMMFVCTGSICDAIRERNHEQHIR